MFAKTIFAVSLICFSVQVWAQETVQLLTYHLHPPFINAPQEGLTYSLETFLNEQANGKYQFQVVELPRKRLDQAIEEDGPWVALWSSPAWFGDVEQQRYWWIPLLKDSSVILSPASAPVNWKGPESLKGLTFVGMRGHRYVGIDPLVEAGAIQRIDNNREEDIVRMLLNQRADVGLLPGSTMKYFKRKMKLEGRIFIAPEPHSQMTRHFFVPRSRKDLATFLESIDFAQNPEWQQALVRYGFD